MSVHWPIIRACLRRPGEAAVVDDQRTWSRGALVAAAYLLADRLATINRTKRLALLLPTSGLTPLAALAGWMLDRTVVPLNYLLKPEELQFVVDDCGTDTVVTVQPMLDYLGAAPRGVGVLRLEDVNFKTLPEPRVPAFNGDDETAVLLYTSGTSGRPKGVPLTHGNLSANLGQIQRWIRFSRDEVMLGVLPQFHSFGLTVLTLLPLTVGCRVVYTARFVPAKIVRLFREHRPTVFVAIPSMFNALLHVKDAGPEDFSSVRYAVSGGEPLPEAVARGFFERFGVRICEGYGLTETSPVSNWCRPGDYRPRSVGMPLPDVEQRIVDLETGEPVPPGDEGEIRMKGPNVFGGYFRRPVETAAAFDRAGYFRTGDIGRFDADGHLYITGRLKEMLIIGGENVFPREIEEVLNAHEHIKDSGVVGLADPMRGEVPIAFVEPREGCVVDPRAVQSYCRGRLAQYKVPAEVRVVAALPRNPTGKVMRRELKAMLADPPAGPA